MALVPSQLHLQLPFAYADDNDISGFVFLLTPGALTGCGHSESACCLMEYAGALPVHCFVIKACPLWPSFQVNFTFSFLYVYPDDNDIAGFVFLLSPGAQTGCGVQ